MYVDDLVIFTRGNMKEAITIQSIQDKYCLWFGEHVNLNKSMIYLSSNLNGEHSHRICLMLKIQKATSPIKYLDNLLLLNGCKKEYFNFIIHKLKSKLNSQKCKLVSQAGRTNCIKSILYNILIYSISTFKLPVRKTCFTRLAQSQFYQPKETRGLRFGKL